MSHVLNDDIAGRLEEVARILAEQGANRFRVKAYHRAAAALRELPRPVSEIFAEKGLAGLEGLPSVGESIARSIRDILVCGKFVMLDRLRGEHDPVALLRSVAGTRGTRHYTALYSNTARAHELGKTNDWVVLYFEGRGTEQQCTVITSEFGKIKGRRIVCGREDECVEHYHQATSPAAWPLAHAHWKL